MRFLFSGVPAFGHLLPLFPLIWAAQQEGHDVAVLTAAGMAPFLAVELPGVLVLSAGPMPDAVFAEVDRRIPESGLPANPQPTAVAEFFAGARVDLSVDEGIDQARAWRPDLVIAEMTDFVGPLVAAALGVPWSTHAWGAALPEEYTTAMQDLVASKYLSRQLVPTRPQSYLDPVPPILQLPGWAAPVTHQPVRPQPHQRPSADEAAVVFPGSGRRRILITLGTVFSNLDLIDALVGALDPDSYDVIATIGLLPGVLIPSDTDTVRYVGFVQLATLLQGVDAVICAGGAGTVLSVFSQGIPLVVMPQGADQHLNANRARATGAAIVALDPSEAAEAVTAALDDPAYADAARNVARQIAAMPEPAVVVRALAAA